MENSDKMQNKWQQIWGRDRICMGKIYKLEHHKAPELRGLLLALC